jgi:hypothetical protein
MPHYCGTDGYSNTAVLQFYKTISLLSFGVYWACEKRICIHGPKTPYTLCASADLWSKLSMSPRLYKSASKWTTYSPVAHRNLPPHTHSHKWIPSSPPPPSSSIPPPTRRTAEAPATPTASLPRASPSPPTRRPPGAAETPTVLLLERTRNHIYSTSVHYCESRYLFLEQCQ